MNYIYIYVAFFNFKFQHTKAFFQNDEKNQSGSWFTVKLLYLRRLGATFAYNAHIPIQEINRHGTWSSDCVWQYIQSYHSSGEKLAYALPTSINALKILSLLLGLNVFAILVISLGFHVNNDLNLILL